MLSGLQRSLRGRARMLRLRRLAQRRSPLLLPSFRVPGASSYAQAAYPGDRLLAAGRPVSDVTCICADFQ